MGNNKIITKPVDRFWKHVIKGNDDECWEWQGATIGMGYGYFRGRYECNEYTHRFSWEIEHGPIPQGLCVCHKCDNPTCVNPKHLFLGTIGDNNRDMYAKGRANPYRFTYQDRLKSNSKLSESQVREIKKMPGTNKKAAFLFNVSESTIRRIRVGESWRNV